MEYRIDYKEAIERISKLDVYPVIIPEGAKYPCIEMQISGGRRDDDSSLNGTSISNHRISLIVCASTLAQCYEVEKLLKTGLHNKTLNTDNTKTLVIYFDNSVESYNHAQSLFELTIDFLPKLIN